ncbi:MAG: matrixin family metalloprotease, partial [Pseudomonadota bacterium]
MKLNLKKWGDPTFGTTGGTVTFSFSRPDEAAPGWSRVKGAARQDLARQAFEDWADVLDLKFREVKGDADIHFGFAPLDGLGGARTGEAEVTSTADGRVVSASILLDVDEKWIYDPEWNGCFTFACLPEGFAIPIGGSAADLLDDESNFYYVALHEVGHAIGILSHFDKDGTVMKGGHSAISLSRTDIKVAQRLYGDDPDGEVKRGDDGKDALNGGAKNDKLFGRGGADGLKGRGGDDLLDGGAGRDVLTGGAGDDLLDGGAGRDVLTGGAGDDRL